MIQIDQDYLRGLDAPAIDYRERYDSDYFRGLDMDPMTPVLVIGGIGLVVWLALAGLTSWGAYRVVKKITEP